MWVKFNTDETEIERGTLKNKAEERNKTKINRESSLL